MTFGSFEVSTDDGRPVELYKFSTSTSGLNFFFTNAEDIVNDGSDDYIPASVVRTQPTQSQQKKATEMKLVLPYLDTITDSFAQLMITAPTEGTTSLVIQRVHLTDSGNEFVQFWSGNVHSAAYNDKGEVELLCRGIKNIFQREGPRMTWGGSCQNTLFDANCGVTEGDFTTFDIVVSAISSDGVTITLGAGVPSPIPSWLGGKCIKDNGVDKRMIVAQADNVITLQQPFRSDFAVGDTVDITQGCDHLLTGDCITTFDNGDRNGGFPFTPGLNPMVEGLDKL